VKINGRDFDNFKDIVGANALMDKGSYYTIERNGEILDIPIPGNLIDRLGDKNIDGFVDYYMPFHVETVVKGSNAEIAGLQHGDIIVKVNEQNATHFPDFKDALEKNANQEVNLQVERAGNITNLNAQVTKEGTLSFNPKILLNFAATEYTLGESVVKGTKDAFQSAWLNIRGVGKLFNGEVSFSSMKGPMGIAQIYSGTWDCQRFWVITGVLSMWLAFVNFLPIPALDGGHVAFLSYEIVSGNKPSDSFLETPKKEEWFCCSL
jgi:regulator of sigma E protease